MADQKKFLDAEGVKYLWSKINMQDYPNNETLMDVIEAIDETKADKSDLVPMIEKHQEKMIVFNGETEGLEVFNKYFYKISDEILSLENLRGGHYLKLTDASMMEPVTITFDDMEAAGNIYPSSSGAGYNINNMVLLVTK